MQLDASLFSLWRMTLRASISDCNLTLRAREVTFIETFDLIFLFIIINMSRQLVTSNRSSPALRSVALLYSVLRAEISSNQGHPNWPECLIL